MINFIYLAHSKVRFHRQTRYSILTLLEYLHRGDMEHRIIVYTDDNSLFSDLEVHFENVDQALLSAWMGPLNFIHRSKIMVLLDLPEKYNGHVVFLDSDNCIFKDPAPVLKKLDEGFAIMDKPEYQLNGKADKLGKKYQRFFRKNPVISTRGLTIRINPGFTVWNSGCIGIPEPHRHIVKEVLPVCDYLHARFPKHLSEQLAFGIIIDKHLEILPFSDFSFHWFGRGQAINRIIEKLFDKCSDLDLEQQVKLISENKQAVLSAPLNPDKRAKWYHRIFRR